MRAILLLPVALFAVMGFAEPSSVTLNRTFKEGEVDRYTVNLAMTMTGGDATIDMTMTQTVKKVYPNGDADVETALTDVKIMMFGSPMTTPKEPPTVQRVDRRGMPIGVVGATSKKPGFEVLKLAAVLMDRAFEVGKPVAIEALDPKDPKSKIKGSAKLEKVADGVAKVKSDLEIWNDLTLEGPMKAAFSWGFDTVSGKPNTAEGKLSNLPQPTDGSVSPAEIKVKMVRVLPK